MADEEKKIILGDEDWKERAQEEKEKLSEQLDHVHEDHPELPEPTFSIFISGLATEAYMALGEIENPVTKEKKRDLHHAKYIIDMIGMIKEKTDGNLDKDEAEGIEAILYDIRMRFVTYSKPQTEVE